MSRYLIIVTYIKYIDNLDEYLPSWVVDFLLTFKVWMCVESYQHT